MKKLLALVLALVMVMGLATVGANAAVTYSDADSIRYKEAVDVMSAIGVLAGTDGKFNPTEPLTREQGAKIITYMILGQKAADALTAPSAPFTDVAADRWSAGSIAYCKSLGIMGGNGDGTVTPAAPLTGAAFAKMLLCALGYDAAREGLGGSDWTLNVARLVNSTGLSDDLDAMPYNSAITRQEAAQMALNTMETTMVDYAGNNLTVDRDGNLAAPRESVGNSVYSYNDTAAGTAGSGVTMQFVENYYPNLKKHIGVDAFGTPTVFWWEGITRNDTAYASSKVTASAANGDTVKVYTAAVKVKDIYSDLGLSSSVNLATIDIDHNGLGTGADGVGIYIDGYEYSTAAQITLDGVGYTSDATAITTINSTQDTKIGGNGIETTVVYNKQVTPATVTISLKNTYLFAATADYNANTKKLAVQQGLQPGVATTGRVAGVGNLISSINGDPAKDDYFECVVGAKEDDLFLGTATYNGTKFAIEDLKPVTSAVLDAKVSGYKSGDSVTANGTAYKYTANMKSNVAAFGGGTGLASDLTDTGTAYNAASFYYSGKATNGTTYAMSDTATYDLALDDYGYVIGAKVHTKDNVAGDYVFIRDVDDSGFNYTAKVTFMDGSTGTVTISKVNDNDPTAISSKTTQGGVGGWTTPVAGGAVMTGTTVYALHFYTYTRDSSGNYRIKGVLSQNNDGGNINATSVTANPLAGATAVIANNDSVVVANKTAYVGVKNLPKVTTGSTYYVTNGSGYLVCAYNENNGTSSSASSDIVFLFGTPATAKVGDDDPYYVYDAIKDGAKTTVNGNIGTRATGMIGIKSYDSKTGVADLKYTTETGTAENYTADFTDVVSVDTSKNAGDIVYKDGTVTVTGKGSYILDSSAQIYLIDISEKSVDQISASGLNALDSTVGANYNVYLFQKSTSNTDINLIYVTQP